MVAGSTAQGGNTKKVNKTIVSEKLAKTAEQGNRRRTMGAGLRPEGA